MPRRLSPLPHCRAGAFHCPGCASPPKRTHDQRLVPGRPRGLWAYKHPPATWGVRTLRPPPGRGRRGWYHRLYHRHQDRVRPAGRHCAWRDNTGDLAMANAETAVVDVNEENEDIL